MPVAAGTRARTRIRVLTQRGERTRTKNALLIRRGVRVARTMGVTRELSIDLNAARDRRARKTFSGLAARIDGKKIIFLATDCLGVMDLGISVIFWMHSGRRDIECDVDVVPVAGFSTYPAWMQEVVKVLSVIVKGSHQCGHRSKSWLRVSTVNTRNRGHVRLHPDPLDRDNVI